MPSPVVSEDDVDAELDDLQAAEAEAAADAQPEPAPADTNGTSNSDGVEEALAQPVASGDASFFDGTESVDDDGQAAVTGDEPGAPPGGELPTAADMEPGEHSFEEPINEGCARLAVVGLDDDSQSDLEGEFEEVFESFQLGHYGNRVMQDYLLRGADDISPIWGLAGSALLCTTMVVYLRPDGDELVSTASDRLSGLRSGNGGGA